MITLQPDMSESSVLYGNKSASLTMAKRNQSTSIDPSKKPCKKLGVSPNDRGVLAPMVVPLGVSTAMEQSDETDEVNCVAEGITPLSSAEIWSILIYVTLLASIANSLVH